MSHRTLRRIIDGTAKLSGERTALNIREAYRGFLKEKIEELQSELRNLEREDEILEVWDFDLRIADLKQKLDERKELLKNDSTNR